MSVPTTQFLQAGCPSCSPTNSAKALKAHYYILEEGKTYNSVQNNNNLYRVVKYKGDRLLVADTLPRCHG